MRKALLASVAIAAIAACRSPAPSRTAVPIADDAESWFRFLRTYPAKPTFEGVTGTIPPRLRAAPPLRPAFALTAAQWTLVGPQPIFDSINTLSSFSGRVTAVAAHPRDASTLYIGADNGGVWKTTDGGSSWLNVTPDLSYPAIDSLAIDPINPSIVYASTPPVYGSQFLRTTDAGASWQVLPLTDAAGQAVTVLYRILIDGRRAGTADATTMYLLRGGWLYRSDDGGKTLRTILTASSDVGGPTSAFDEFLQDVAIDAADHVFVVTTRYACTGDCSSPDKAIIMYRSADGGGHWDKRRIVNLADFYPTTRIAIAPDLKNIVVSFRDSQAQNVRVMRSTDVGDTWNEFSVPKPTSYAWTNMLGLSPAGDTVFVGNLRLNRSVNWGQSWVDMGALHEDQGVMTFDASGNLVLGSDGGVFRAPSPTGLAGSFKSLNNALSLTECYSVAAHPTNPLKLLIGTQDNGTVEYLGAGGWNHVFSGDGGDVAFDTSGATTGAYLETQWSTSYAFEYCADGGGCQQRTTGLDRTLAAPFIPRFAVDPSNTANVFLTTERLYRTQNRGASWTAVTPSVLANQRCWDDGTGHHCGNAYYFMAVTVAPGAPSTVYAGTGNGDVWLSSSSGDTWTSVATATLPVRPTTQIAVDPSDAGTAYVAFGGSSASGGAGHVFRTSTAGRTWTDISGDLPDIPVYAILIDASATPRALYVGTDFGVMRSVDDGSGHWEAFNNGLPSVPVQRLVYNDATHTLLAATYGRGVWAISNRFTP